MNKTVRNIKGRAFFEEQILDTISDPENPCKEIESVYRKKRGKS